MRKFKDEFKTSRGFSLIELMIGMALLAGATLGASKVMEMLNKMSRSGEIKSELTQTLAINQKLIDINLNGLSDLEFNEGLLYELDKNTGDLVRVGSMALEPEVLKNDWLRRVTEKNYQSVYTSLNFVKKSSKNDPLNKRYERYYSVCLPIDSAVEFYQERKLGVDELANVERWPFIKQLSNGNMHIRCCPLDTPNCDDTGSNPLKEDAQYVLRIVRDDYLIKFEDDPMNPGTLIEKSRAENVSLTPKQGGLRTLSGAGFFMYRSDNKLMAYMVFYYSGCISERVLKKDQGVTECKNRIYLKHKLRSFPIDTKMGAGATDVGNIGW